MPLIKAVTLASASCWLGACSLSTADSPGSSTRGGRWSALPPVLSAETDTPGYFNRGALVYRFRYTSSQKEHPAKPEMVTAANSQCAGNKLWIPRVGVWWLCSGVLSSPALVNCGPSGADDEHQQGKGSWAGRHHRGPRCGQTVYRWNKWKVLRCLSVEVCKQSTCLKCCRGAGREHSLCESGSAFEALEMVTAATKLKDACPSEEKL